MKAFFSYLLFFILILQSCSPGYISAIVKYKETFSENNSSTPDYSNLKYWAAHPWKKDLSDSTPAPLQLEKKDSLIDVFFLHPTTFTDKRLNGIVWNADINDPKLNAKTDYGSILYQASVFNQNARVFAPRYRQAHIASFYATDNNRGKEAIDLAYEDVKAAFENYLKNFNNDRPIIIASHSQGTVHAARLLKDFFENKPLQKKLVCAYLVGMVIPKEYFTLVIPACVNSSSTGCFTAWRTFRKNYTPDFVKKESSRSWVTNPISWKLNEENITRQKNKGAVLYNFNKIIAKPNGAQIHEGILWVEKPKFPGGVFYFSKNYHAGDINLFYINIRENIKERIEEFQMQVNK